MTIILKCIFKLGWFKQKRGISAGLWFSSIRFSTYIRLPRELLIVLFTVHRFISPCNPRSFRSTQSRSFFCGDSWWVSLCVCMSLCYALQVHCCVFSSVWFWVCLCFELCTVPCTPLIFAVGFNMPIHYTIRFLLYFVICSPKYASRHW